MTTFTNWTFSVAGNIGPTGATGPAGTNGTNGTNGTTGATGATGAEGSRNVLINGAFDIWQRGTSFPGTAGTRTFIADRWYVFPSGGNLAQVSRAAFIPSAFGTYSAYSLLLVGNSSVTTCLLGQRIEAANMPSLRRTVIFSARIYNITGASFNPSLILSTPDAEDNFSSVTQRSINALQSCASGAWTTVTWTGDISGYTNIAYGLQVEIEIPSGSLNSMSKFFIITEVQLEKGSVATPFARRSIGEELLLCQRYYQIGRLAAAGYGIVATVDSGAYGNFSFPTRMRATPTITELTKALGGSPVGYSSGTTYIDASGFGFRYNHGGGGGGSGSGNLSFDLTWSAAAEL